MPGTDVPGISFFGKSGDFGYTGKDSIRTSQEEKL
jgi:hypothetical protein